MTFMRLSHSVDEGSSTLFTAIFSGCVPYKTATCRQDQIDQSSLFARFVSHIK